MKEEIKELKKILIDVTKRIEKLENDENDYELYLKVNEENYLIICFDCNGYEFDLGYITDIGECHILSNDFHKEKYELWLRKGLKVKEDNEVEWKGKKYLVDDEKTLRSVMLHGAIYDFEFACPRVDCKDENIIRYSNKVPILY